MEMIKNSRSIVNEVEIKNSKILVVDDMEFNVMVIEKLLQTGGFKYIYLAKNGLEALKMTKEINPDAVILDLVMPEMDGFEYCRTIRGEESFSTLPIIVQTSINLQKQKSLAFSCGATDFINKPIDADELIARVNIHLENHFMLKKLKSFQERLNFELESAKHMQEQLMPTPQEVEEFKRKYNVSLYSCFQPSSELGGDFWSFRHVDDDRFAVYITDFSGHGIGSAINTFRLHDVMADNKFYNTDPGLLLADINTTFIKLLPSGQFATMFYGIIDLKNNQLKYSVAANPSIFIIDVDNKTVNRLEGKGFPLGIENKVVFETKTISFNKHDIIFLFSDAYLETPDASGNCFEEQQLFKFVNDLLLETVPLTADLLYNKIYQHFNEKYAKNLKDDLTICIYQRN